MTRWIVNLVIDTDGGDPCAWDWEGLVGSPVSSVSTQQITK